LPDGGFLVTYDSGNGTLASQRFDENGNELGGPTLMSGYGQSGAITTVLSDGTVLLLSDNAVSALTAATFSVPFTPMNWSGATSTDLGTAGDWDLNIVPDTGHGMQFGLANGGTLMGAATAGSATFTGAGGWLLSGATVSLTQGLSEQSTLTVTGGTITAGGTAAVGVTGQAVLNASGGAKLTFQSTAVGTTGGQTGALSVSGAGTTLTDSGSRGAGGLQAGSSTTAQPGRGIVSISQGATVIGSDADIFGVTAGSEGDLSLAGGGISDQSMVVGASGMGTVTVTGGTLASATALTIGQNAGGQGVLTVSGIGAAVVDPGSFTDGAAGGASVTIQNQGTVRIGGTTVASPGIDLGHAGGGSGAITVLGTNSLLNNTGSFIVGDGGLGNLSIASGGTVVTGPGTVGYGLLVSNGTGAAGSSVNVTGAGSNLSVNGLLDVGVGGSGALQISGGATVSAGSLDVGNVAAAGGQIDLSGQGSELLVSGAATVADDGTGVMSVLNGATFAAASLTVGNTGNSSGALVVSGSGSTVQLSGALNIGTPQGTGDLTVGPGAAIHAAVVNLKGEVVLEGGLLDPTVNLINQGQTAGGFGTIAADMIVDEGVIQAGGSKVSQKLLLVSGTVLGGGTMSTNGTAVASSPSGVLRINAGGTMELTGPVLNATTTTFTDGLTPSGTYVVNNSVVDVIFADATGVLLLDDIGGFAGTISAFQAGDQLIATGETLSNLGVSNGNTLTFSDSGPNAGSGNADRIIFASAISSDQFNIVNGNTVQSVQSVACFAAGTMIATTRGHVPVQHVRPGDRVCTVLNADIAKVIWTGYRPVDCARHPDPTKVWPIRISAHAFGLGMPSSDLLLSPDHAVFVDGVLIPIRFLVNGYTVRQELVEQITYHHIELAEHDVLLANGMPAESYLDTGDRMRFSNGGGVVALHPDFSARAWETRGCAPLAQTGPALAAARKRLASEVARRKRHVRERFAPGTNWPN
jgi:T5SS/PEP-CTERM-associated repeat protein